MRGPCTTNRAFCARSIATRGSSAAASVYISAPTRLVTFRAVQSHLFRDRKRVPLSIPQAAILTAFWAHMMAVSGKP